VHVLPKDVTVLDIAAGNTTNSQAARARLKGISMNIL